MVARSYKVEFDGYWNEAGIDEMPNESGVYVVYGSLDKTMTTIDLRLLIYIGEAEKVGERLTNHEKKPTWHKYLGIGENFRFAFGPVAGTDRERVEAALHTAVGQPGVADTAEEAPLDRVALALGVPLRLLIKRLGPAQLQLAARTA